jgi:outer membrane protein OmpA-like peptidoglycan-associated protein
MNAREAHRGTLHPCESPVPLWSTRERERAAIKIKPRLHVIAIGVLVGWTAFAVFAIFLLRPEPPPCPDERPGLWLRFGGERPQLSGRAPTAAKAIAVIVAVDYWGYPLSTVCSSGITLDATWTKVATAVYRAPLAHLRTGEVMVRPDLVVIVGQAWTKARRDELESSVRKNLAAAGLATIPTLMQIGVSPDPALLLRLAALDVSFSSRSAEISSGARFALTGLVQELGHTDSPIMVIGHADATGRASKNGAISQQRADAVRELLVKAGIPSSRITALGEGDRMPIANNTTPEGRAANRRVVIELVATGDR